MARDENQDDDRGRRAFGVVRDWVLLAIGAGVIVAETVGSLVFSRPVDGLLIGAAITLCGGSLVLQKEKT